MNTKNKEYSLVYFSSDDFGKIYFNSKNNKKYTKIVTLKMIKPLLLRFIKEYHFYKIIVQLLIKKKMNIDHWISFHHDKPFDIFIMYLENQYKKILSKYNTYNSKIIKRCDLIMNAIVEFHKLSYKWNKLIISIFD